MEKGIRFVKWRCLALLAGFVSLLPAAGLGQEIRFDPRPDWPAERRFADFLAAGGYVVIQADTVLGADDVVDANLLVLEADVRIEGRVTGTLASVGGDVFLRPGAVVGGDVLILGGGYYSSRLAEVQGAVTYRPNDIYVIQRLDSGMRIHPIREVPETFTLHGLSGILFPTYQRVDGWTFGFGATVRHVSGPWQPSLEARLGFSAGRDRVLGSIRQSWYPTASLTFGLEGERVTRTNDDWVRRDVANTLSYLFTGEDFRNYYESERATFFIRGTEAARWSPIVELSWEQARSLAAEDHFVLFAADESAPNPAIDPGDIGSLKVGAAWQRRTPSNSLQAEATIEAADSSTAGDFTFVLGVLQARWKGRGFISHLFEASIYAQGDLSGTPPRQRWTAIGGRATIPTVPILSLGGSRLVYGQATYLVPLETLRVGMLGAPMWFVRVAAGTGWEEGEAAVFERNLTTGLRLSIFELAVAFDPDESASDVAVYGILRFPGDL